MKSSWSRTLWLMWAAPLFLLACAEPLDAGPGPVSEGVFETPFGPQRLQYVVDGEDAIVGGDIRIPLNALVEGDEVTAFAAMRPMRDRWPGGVIPYELDPAFTAAQRTAILNAVNHVDASTALSFVPRTSERAYVRFVFVPGEYPSAQCNAALGFQEYEWGRREHTVNLPNWCINTPGDIVHEIGHVAGLWHEQQRLDRDLYVDIHWQNMPTDLHWTYAKLDRGQDMGAYDYGSVMHYPSMAGSSNGQPTMTRKDGTLIYQATLLSGGDIAAINAHYNGWPLVTSAWWANFADGQHIRTSTVFAEVRTNNAPVVLCVRYWVNGSQPSSSDQQWRWVDGVAALCDTTEPFTVNASHWGAEGSVNQLQARVDQLYGPPLFLSGSFTYDTTPPTLSATLPSGAVSGNVSMSATASDALSTPTVSYRVYRSRFAETATGGVSAFSDIPPPDTVTCLGGTVNAPPYQAVFDTRACTNGTWYVQATARDRAGNSTQSPTSAISVFNLETWITAPGQNQTVGGNVRLAAGVDGHGTGINQVEFFVNGAPAGVDTVAPYEVYWNSTGKSCTASYAVTSRVTASNLRTATSPPVSFKVACPYSCTKQTPCET